MAQVTPLNIAAAALVAEFSLCLTIFITVWIVPSFRKLMSFVALLFLVSFGTLIFSSDQLALARALFGNTVLSGLQTSTALLINFSLMIFVLGGFIFITGGITKSPFSSILFIIVPLAIFLRESFWHFLYYLCLILIVSLIGYLREPDERWISKEDFSGHPSAFVTSHYVSATLCLLLTSLVGWITRAQ